MTSILGNEWHISLSGDNILTSNGSLKDKQQIYNIALNTDLKEICKPVLHEFTNNDIPKTVLQIHKLRNISAPKANEESQVAPRLLKLTLTDGETYIQAFELVSIPALSLKNTVPGTKLLLENVKMSSGYLLLTPQNCKVLGGKVAHLLEKWEITKSVQKNRRNVNNDEDGPPPWVNFGTKIKTGNQESNFKSLGEKSKESKESSEFDQQRQDAIAEASSGAVKKVFSGKVKLNVQVQNTTKKNTDKPREKKETGKFKKLSSKEIEEKPMKPSDKVSLFAFLEDKLPISNKEENVYSIPSNQPIFKDLKEPEQNKFEYKKSNIAPPREFKKPDNKYQIKTRNDTNSVEPMQKASNNNLYRPKSTNSNSFQSQRPTYNRNDQNKPKYNPQPNNSFQQFSHQNIPQPSIEYPQQNYSLPHQSNIYPYLNNNPYQSQHNVNSVQYTLKRDNYQNSNSFNKETNDIGHVTQEMQKITINGQFASRSLKQHLNLKDDRKKVENNATFGNRFNIGDEVMAKYWEDGKFYNAKIISETDRTFAVMFRDYGNIEEVLKSDCQPLSSGYSKSNLHRNNRQYSAPMEYKRKNYK